MPVTATASRIKGLLIENKEFLSASMLATVAGLPQTRLAAALRGAFHMESTEEAALLTLTYRCIRVLRAILPLRIAAGDGETLKLLVNSGREAEDVHQFVMMLMEPSHSAMD